LWLTGRWDDSLALAARCHDERFAVFHRFQAAMRRGEPPPAEVSDSDDTVITPATSPSVRLCQRLAAARSAVPSHEEQGIVRLREALELLPLLELRAGEGFVLLAELASELPDPDAALEASIREKAEEVLCQGALDDAWLAQLEAIRRRHHGEDDAETWLQTTQTWDQMGAPVEAARCRLPLAEHLLRGGDRDSAAHELSQALHAFDTVGAIPSSAAARRLAASARLALPGERVGPSSERAGLTEREYEVLQLLVMGRKNDEIAAALYLSPKTVSVHVSHILQKFGAANRTEVAVIAHQRGMIETS
jgi:DNA-binding CsgD family transcriptional regulator